MADAGQCLPWLLAISIVYVDKFILLFMRLCRQRTAEAKKTPVVFSRPLKRQPSSFGAGCRQKQQQATASLAAPAPSQGHGLIATLLVYLLAPPVIQW